MNLHFNPRPKPVAQRKEPKKPAPKTKAVMAQFNKAAFVAERGRICECGECGETESLDAHHCLIGRMKGHPELDVPENLVLVSHFEHVSLRKFNNLEWRKKFYLKNLERYGEKRMMDWIESLPVKMAHRIDFLP
jgi:hypothetical protein